MQKILILSDRGQITIPKKIREKIQTSNFTCAIESGRIVLTPINIKTPYSQKEEGQKSSWSDV